MSLRAITFTLAAAALLCACANTSAPQTAAPQGAPLDCSRSENGGARVLCHEMVVAASAEAVWRLISTSDGARTWAAPLVAIDLREGGLWESSYRSGARLGDADTIHNRIVSVAPGRALTIQIERAPPGFEHVNEARQLQTTISIEPRGAAHTRVRIEMRGYRAGAAFDALYQQFARGNAFSLQKLSEAAAGQPVDWAAMRSAPAQPADVME